MTRGQLPQRAGSLGLNDGGTAAAVPPPDGGTTSGGTAISGGGTPDTGGGTPFWLDLTTADTPRRMCMRKS